MVETYRRRETPLSKVRLLVVTTTCEIVTRRSTTYARLPLIVIACCSKIIIFIYIWLEGQVAEQKAMIQAMCTLLYPDSEPRLWRVLSSTNDTLANVERVPDKSSCQRPWWRYPRSAHRSTYTSGSTVPTIKHLLQQLRLYCCQQSARGPGPRRRHSRHTRLRLVDTSP